MRKFIKIISVLTLLVMMLSALSFAAGCGDENDGENSSWDGFTYTVYVYLDDGVTPVKDAKIAYCYDKEGSGYLCASPIRTDENGKISFSMEGKNSLSKPVIHFTGGIPAGYDIPADFKDLVVGGTTAEHSKELTEAVTKIVLVKK